jgi:hypothetical protein
MAAKFLIDHEYVTHDELINLFLNFNLLQSIYHTERDNFLSPFSQLIAKNAEKLISELYVCQKTCELFSLKPTITRFVMDGHYNKIDLRDKKAFFLQLPEENIQNDAKLKKHVKIALDLFQYDSGNLDEKYPTNDQEKNNTHDLRSNRYLKDKIDFYRSILSREKYLALAEKCLHLLNTLDRYVEIFQPGDAIALLAPVHFHYVEDYPHEFSFAEIILEHLNAHFSFDYQMEYRQRIKTENLHTHFETVIITAI